MLSYTSQTEDKYCMIPLSKVMRLVKFTETESTIEVTRGWGGQGAGKEEIGNECLMGTEFHFCADENKFWN